MAKFLSEDKINKAVQEQMALGENGLFDANRSHVHGTDISWGVCNRIKILLSFLINVLIFFNKAL